ncbi:MAG: ABC transporter ATP-binding protein [Candidatus Schekmanbacteria bacterium]|nr:ABC transporter ATP-binding protein [Candidatus Schekmanbacteria bacterium]
MQLRFEKLTKTYPGGIVALRDVSLTIPPGMFGLLGPNGAGKSTLMRILATLQEPDSGGAWLGDIDILKDKMGLRRVLGYLPQEFGLYPKVSALEMLDHLAVLKDIGPAATRKRMVLELLQRTNLHEVRKRSLGSFSGGMKQRFGIAQALLGKPRLIIVDEPTAGLDPEERVRFHNLLAEIGEDIVVLLSTHIVDDVGDLCAAMAVIFKGELLLAGSPLEQIRMLRGKVWRKLVNKDAVAQHAVEHPVISSRLFAGRTLIHVLADAAPDAGFEPVEPTLEDVYFATIRRRQAGVTPAVATAGAPAVEA